MNASEFESVPSLTVTTTVDKFIMDYGKMYNQILANHNYSDSFCKTYITSGSPIFLSPLTSADKETGGTGVNPA